MAEIIVFVVTGVLAEHWTKKPEFSFIYGLLAVLVTICFHVVTELKQLSDRIGKLSEGLPSDVVNHSAFQAVLLSESFVAIHKMGDPLFTGIAANEIRDLAQVLNHLKDGEYKVAGDYVYLTYERLINSLTENETYRATTYVDDSFWKLTNGKVFLRRNIEAVKRGAKITRIFFYKGNNGFDVRECPVVKMHVDARSSLKPNEQVRLELRMLEISGKNVRDIGILKDRYLMQITSDAHSEEINATILIDATSVRQALDDWDTVFRITDGL